MVSQFKYKKNIDTPNRTDIFFYICLIACVKNEKTNTIRFKIAISLNKLLQLSDHYKESGKNFDKRATSYALIALYADLRKATVSDTFNAKSTPSAETLLLIIAAMGFTLSQFSTVYDALDDAELTKLRKHYDD